MSDLQYDVFISYKREDQGFAEALRERLIAWNYSVWMDVHDIPPGADWLLEVEKGLQASRIVMGIMTVRSVCSRNVLNEWEWAVVNGKRLILLKLEPCEIPLNVIRINHLDFTVERESAFEQLHLALESPVLPPKPLADPYHDYLRWLYELINRYLAQKIIRTSPDDLHSPEPIPLITERTRGAVDTRFERRDEIHPLFVLGGIEQESAWVEADFSTAFSYFDGRVLLLGEPGAGKTITLLHFGRDAIVRRFQDMSEPLPVLGIIPTWDAQTQMPLIDWLAASYGAPPDAARVLSEGRALLLLDGLDELGSEREDTLTHERYTPRERFIKALAEMLADSRRNLQIVVTCRVRDYEQMGAKIALKGAVRLKPLDDTQIRAYLSEMPDLWTAVGADPILREMARTPLLLSFFAFAYRDQGAETARLRDLRHSPSDLRDAIFAQYVRKQYEYEERKLTFRGEPTAFTLEQMASVLGQVAVWNLEWLRSENILPYKDFERALSPGRAQKFVDLAVRLHLLAPGGKAWLRVKEEDTFRFVHLLLRDHFAFRLLNTNLQHEDPTTRARAVDTLGRLGDPRVVQTLIMLLSDKVREVRVQAAEALGRLVDPQAVEPLMVALHDRVWEVRASAAYALGRIGDSRAVEALCAVLNDPAEGVRVNAARALGQLGGSRAVDALCLALRDDHRKVRARAALALGKSGDPRAVEPLGTALRDMEADVRACAAEALGEINDEQVIALLIAALKDKDKSVRARAVEALAKWQDNRTVEPFMAALSDNEWWVRARAAEALGKLKDLRAVKPLIAALADEERWVRSRAARALEQIGTPEALAAVEIWRKAQREN